MRRLQRRVAEEEASADDVRLYFVSSNRGRARVADLVLNRWGEIENVAIVANGREAETNADANCQLSCVETLRNVVAEEVVAIDNQRLILQEYRNRLDSSGRPGVGDAFFKHVWDHQHQDGRVQQVVVTPCDDDSRGFEELPENAFDRSDRKFLAVAVVARALVLNATDSDWREQQALMDRLGVEVRQLCPQYRRAGGRGR